MQRFRAATATVALVSRDAGLVEVFQSLILEEATSVAVYPSFEGMLSALMTTAPDVVVFDDRAEFDALQQMRLLRRRLPSIHILYVNVVDESRSIVLLRNGADDAITTSAPTLVARLQSATRRARTVNAGVRIAVGDIVFDREAGRVWCAGREVSLTPHELGVVDCLFWHTPTPVNIDTLSDFVWGESSSTNRRSLVQVYISYVRKKLKDSTQVAIRFARGSGYEFFPRD